jgi:hypothetical protein
MMLAQSNPKPRCPPNRHVTRLGAKANIQIETTAKHKARPRDSSGHVGESNGLA